MATQSEDLQFVIKAVDQASATLKAVEGALKTMGETSKTSSTAIEALGNKLGSLGQAIKSGFGAALGFSVFNELQNGLRDLVDFIPNAISAGLAWADSVHQMMLETGLAAEDASGLMAVMQHIGVPIDAVNTLMTRLGANLASNVKNFTALGITTRDNTGAFLSTDQILSNILTRFSAYGDSLTRTGAATKLFGRSAAELLPFLQLTNQQFQDLAQFANQTGLVLTDQAVAGARAFQNTLTGLGQVFQGIQTQIMAGLEPTLQAFVSGFEQFVQAHMQQIIQFVVTVANFVMGVIGGIFGIDFSSTVSGLAGATQAAGAAANNANTSFGNLNKTAGSGAAASKAFSEEIKKQTAAIDAQIAAIDRATAARHNAETVENLQTTLATAQLNLTNIQGQSPYTAGLSGAAAVLAQQTHNQQLIDAEKAVADAKEAITNNALDVQAAAEKQALTDKKARLAAELAAHQATASGGSAASLAAGGIIRADTIKTGGVFKDTFTGMQDVMKSARDAGVGFANDLKTAFAQVMDALLGSETTVTVPGADHTFTSVTTRSGGLVNALINVGKVFQWLADNINFLFGGTNSPWPYPKGKLSNPGTYGGGHATGGFVGLHGPELITVGERGPEEVIPNGGSGPGHGHDIYLDGRLVGQLLDSRMGYRARTAPLTTRPYGSY